MLKYITAGSIIAVCLNLLLQLWDFSLNSINWYAEYWSLKTRMLARVTYPYS